MQSVLLSNAPSAVLKILRPACAFYLRLVIFLQNLLGQQSFEYLALLKKLRHRIGHDGWGKGIVSFLSHQDHCEDVQAALRDVGVEGLIAQPAH